MRAKLKAEWLNPTPWLLTVFLPAGPRNLVFFPVCFGERLHKWETINDVGAVVSACLD